MSAKSAPLARHVTAENSCLSTDNLKMQAFSVLPSYGTSFACWRKRRSTIAPCKRRRGPYEYDHRLWHFAFLVSLLPASARYGSGHRSRSRRIRRGEPVGATTPQASGGTAGLTSDLKIVTTGFTTAPKLSADVIDALLKDQAQQSAATTSTTNTTATTSPGASEETEPTAASSDSSSSDSSSSDPASSKPQSVQDAASQLDPHHLTHQQEEQLIGDLVSSGKLSEKDGLHLYFNTVLADQFNSQHYRIINGQLVATTPSPPGTIVGNDAPGGPQYDVVQRVQQSLAADQYFGDSQNAAQDQKILDALNQLDSIRNGTTA